jgi:hypothetical protein
MFLRCSLKGDIHEEKNHSTLVPFYLITLSALTSTFGGIVRPIWAFTLTQQEKETTKGERLLTAHSNRAQDSTEPFAVSILRSFRVARQL